MASSSRDDCGEKLCIVCHGAPGHHDYYRYIFIKDLDGEEDAKFDFMAPTLKLDSKCLPAEGFCVLGFTLYLFGSVCESESDMGRHRLGRKSVYMYRFPSNISGISDKILEKSDLERIRDMHASKRGIIAIVTPNRKNILAFSRKYDSHVPVNLCDFEIYDPVIDLWYKLPNMPSHWRRFNGFYISGYTFIDDHTILLKTNDIGILTLDISSPDSPDNPEQRWQRISPCANDVPIPRGGFSIFIENDFFLSHNFAYDQTNAFGYPNLSLGDNFIDKSRCLALLDGDDEQKKWKFCVAQTALEGESLIPFVKVNVYEFDLEKYKNIMMEQGFEPDKYFCDLPATTILKTFQFYSNPENTYGCFWPIVLLPIYQFN